MDKKYKAVGLLDGECSTVQKGKFIVLLIKEAWVEG